MIVGAMKDQKLKLRILQEGRKNSTPSIGCHGHAGGTRPGQTCKTPKDLSVHESSEAPSLLSYTLRYVSFAKLGHVCQFGL
jgi:hypothetical protein